MFALKIFLVFQSACQDHREHLEASHQATDFSSYCIKPQPNHLNQEVKKKKKTVWLVKRSLDKHKSLSSSPSTHIKIQGCLSRLVMILALVPGSLSNQPDLLDELQANKRPRLPNEVGSI